jgi:hypothetical protein
MPILAAMSRHLIPAAAAILLCLPAFAESYSAWTPKAVTNARAAFCDTVLSEITTRVERLKLETGDSFHLKFSFPSSDEKELNRFTDRWQQKRFTTKDVEGRWQDLISIAAALSAKEAEARPKWQEKMKAAQEASAAAEKEGQIYGTKVTARKLGAVLDSSPSMSKYLPALRKEIAHQFEDYPSVEIWGSFLTSQPEYRFNSTPRKGHELSEPLDTRWYSLAPGEAEDPFDPAWHFPHSLPIDEDKIHLYATIARRDNVSAILGLVELHKVDAIYWFCDLKDDIEDAAVQRLDTMLTKNRVTLYIHSVGRKPKGALDALVKQSGGKVITQKPRIIAPEKPSQP